MASLMITIEARANDNTVFSSCKLIVGFKDQLTVENEKILIDRQETFLLPDKMPTGFTVKRLDVESEVRLKIEDETGRGLLNRSVRKSDFQNEEGDTYQYTLTLDELALEDYNVPIVQPKASEFFELKGVFIPLFEPKPDFKQFELHLAAIKESHGSELEKIWSDFSTEQNLTDILKKEDLPKLSTLPFRKFVLKFDGSFQATFARGEVGSGWQWLLVSGSTMYCGFISASSVNSKVDDTGRLTQINLSLFLPAFESEGDSAQQPNNKQPGSSSSEPTVNCDCQPHHPLMADEADVIRHPDIFRDDPGPYCEPFKNPNRTFSERRFQTIVRVTDPEIGLKVKETRPYSSFFDYQLNHARPDFVVPTAKANRPLISRFLDAFRSTPASRPKSKSDFEISPIRSTSLNEEDFKSGTITNQIKTLALQKKEWSKWVDLTFKGRRQINSSNPVDWENESSIYQAASLALGHVLEHRVSWKANGYSLGDVLYSLALAPRQTKRINVIDWSRSERSVRSEFQNANDVVNNLTDRNRDYKDSITSSLSEWSRGGSKSSSTGVAGGIGFAGFGIVAGGGAAHGSASSSSWQEGGRNLAAQEEQHLRDTIRQYGESLRKQESTVVQEISQHETVTGISEVIRNPNYGHSLTVVYHQILRHLLVETDLVGIRECLFVPFTIKPFDLVRMVRWRDTLERYCLKPEFKWVFPYLEDVLKEFADSDIPAGRRSDQSVEYVTGSLFIQLAIERPEDGEGESFVPDNWKPLLPFLQTPALGVFEQLKIRERHKRDEYFQKNIAPQLASQWADLLRIESLPGADFTLATQYDFNGVVRVDFSCAPTANVTRAQLQMLVVKAGKALPRNSVANLKRVELTYFTNQFDRKVSSVSVTNDLIKTDSGSVDPMGARVRLPLSNWENENLRKKIQSSVVNLRLHLNEHVEYYHKAIWWNMDRDRLYMMLDGYEMEYTESCTIQGNPSLRKVTRSIASIVERNPMAIMGNTLVFKVSPTIFLGAGVPQHASGEKLLFSSLNDLFDHHRSTGAKREPILVALPTAGVYAQALMDKCNALEEHMGSVDWVLNDKDPELTDLGTEALATRRSEPKDMTPTPFQAPIINLQNAPQAPDPSGLGNILSAITKSDSFRDMAGLAGTQANAKAAMEAAASLASEFGSKAAELQKAKQGTEMANQKMASIRKAQNDGLIEKEEAQKQTSKVLDEMNVKPSDDKVTSPDSLARILDHQKIKNGSEFEVRNAIEYVHVKGPIDSSNLPAGGHPNEHDTRIDSVKMNDRYATELSLLHEKNYVYGADGPDNFDCSGSVCYAIRKAINPDFGDYNADSLFKQFTKGVQDFADAKIGDLDLNTVLKARGTILLFDYQDNGTVDHIVTNLDDTYVFHASGSSRNNLQNPNLKGLTKHQRRDWFLNWVKNTYASAKVFQRELDWDKVGQVKQV